MRGILVTEKLPRSVSKGPLLYKEWVQQQGLRHSRKRPATTQFKTNTQKSQFLSNSSSNSFFLLLVFASLTQVFTEWLSIETRCSQSKAYFLKKTILTISTQRCMRTTNSELPTHPPSTKLWTQKADRSLLTKRYYPNKTRRTRSAPKWLAHAAHTRESFPTLAQRLQYRQPASNPTNDLHSNSALPRQSPHLPLVAHTSLPG